MRKVPAQAEVRTYLAFWYSRTYRLWRDGPVVEPREVKNRNRQGITLPPGARGFYFYDEVRLKTRVGGKRICLTEARHNVSDMFQPV